MEIPKHIYKYEPFTTQSLQNLKAQSLYFSSPLNFNDPYDCALSTAVNEPTEDEINEFKKSYSMREDIPLNIRSKFQTAETSQLKENLVNGAEAILKKHAESFIKEKGVCCFSEKKDDLLMWSHYGSKYKGFCLEFSTEFEPFLKMRAVRYTEIMPKIDTINAMLNDDFGGILDLFYTKSKSWSYEKEWRIIHHHADTLFTYPANALKSIYFGPDIDQQSLEIICLIISGQNSRVKFWRGSRSQERFAVEFEEFSYVSFNEANKSNLIR